MSFPQLITEHRQFEDFCAHVREAGVVACDTEFISDGHYLPVLCLLQLATPQYQVAVDPFKVKDLSSWWQIMSDQQTIVVAHGSREEVRFCLRYANQLPGRLWDVQVAEGLRGVEYPLGYDTLVNRVLDIHISGNQTRSDWRRRPLTSAQLEYALQDVEYLIPIWQKQRQELEQAGRLSWAEEEQQAFLADIHADWGTEGWKSVPGARKLTQRELNVFRAVYAWREQRARDLNCPPRFILSEKQLIDLARRHPTTERELLSFRGIMQNKKVSLYRLSLLDTIYSAWEAPASDWPELLAEPAHNRVTLPEHHAVCRMLLMILESECARLGISPTLTARSRDVSDLVRWFAAGQQPDYQPRLLQGWRKEHLGQKLLEVLQGRIAVRVTRSSESTMALEMFSDPPHDRVEP
ncbi:MAG: ribonuclease D [Planctomycetaceae bacterium]|nr:MAG: ribonuclease D [Planctomycetaceae bacterium]